MCYDFFFFETLSLVAVQITGVKDSRILNMCMAAVKECAFKHTQHMLKWRIVIFIAIASSTMIVFVIICYLEGEKQCKMLIYFILY